jgi:hypothetical protein
MFYVVYRHTSNASSKKTRMKVLGTLSEYKARLFVAERALDMGRDLPSGSLDGNVTRDYYSGSQGSQQLREVEKRLAGPCA